MKRFITPSAVFLYITDIVHGQLHSDPDNPFQIAISTKNNEKVERVRISGTLVDKYHSQGEEGKKTYTAIVIDDGTETIRVKGWEAEAEYLNVFQIGDELDVIGKPRGSEDEIYISSEIVTKIDDYEKVLYQRVIKAKRYVKKKMFLPKEALKVETEDMLAAKELVWSIIVEEVDGVTMDDLIEQTKLEKSLLESGIQDLLREGVIYEPENLKFKKI